MSNKATQQERDFAIVMQQLSAEAEKILPGDQSNSLPEVRDPTEPGQQPDAFFERLHGLENSVLNRLEQIAAQVEASRAAAFAEQFRRIDEQLASIRNTESVNQQMFDSLHAELLKYRDNFCTNRSKSRSSTTWFIYTTISTDCANSSPLPPRKKESAAASLSGGIIWKTPFIRWSKSCIALT